MISATSSSRRKYEIAVSRGRSNRWTASRALRATEAERGVHGIRTPRWIPGRTPGFPASKPSKDDRRRRGQRLRQRRDHLSAEGLGHFAAALLGHADPGDLLRRSAGSFPCRTSDLPVRLPANVHAHRAGPIAAGERAGIREREMPEMRRRRRGARPTRWTRSSIRPGISYRYTDPHNDRAPFDPALARYWFPIDQYIGGIEHAILHLIYSRFFCKVMRDLGLVDHARAGEAAVFAGHGAEGRREDVQVQRQRGRRRSTWRRNTAAIRRGMYTLFAAPPEKDLEWSEQGIEGCARFLQRVFRLVDRHAAALRGGLEPAAVWATVAAASSTTAEREGPAAQGAPDAAARDRTISRRAGTSIPPWR